MKIRILLSCLLVVTFLLSGCSQATPTVQEAPPAQAPAITEAPEKVEPTQETAVEPVKTEEAAAPPSSSDDDKPLVVASLTDLQTIDPHRINSNFPDASVAMWIFDVVVDMDVHGQPVPELAKDWEQIDPLTWEFHLVEGVEFHNGEPVNAEAIRYTFERMSSPDLISFAYIFDQCKLKEVKVIDDYTVQFITEEPSPEVLYWLSRSYIVPPKYYSENTPEFLANNPVGSGPYKFVEWVRDDHLTTTANENYFQGQPAFKDIVVRVIPEASSRLNELITGNVDLAWALDIETSQNANSEVSRLVPFESYRKMHIGIASKAGPDALRDKRVRHALNYAVDKQAIIDSLLQDGTQPLLSVVNPPNNNPDLVPYEYNPEKAIQLLEEAGYPNGFEVTLSTPIIRYGLDKEIALAVASYLEAIGLKVNFEALEWGEYRTRMNAKDLELFYMGFSSYVFPSIELFNFSCGHPSNPQDYCVDEFETKYRELKTTVDPERYQELSYELQAFMWDEAPWIFLWRLPIYIGMSNRLDYVPDGGQFVNAWDFVRR